MNAVAQASGQVLILEHSGVDDLGSRQLLNMSLVSLPTGPRGFKYGSGSDEIACIPANANPQAASYLVPPFVMPSSLAVGANLRAGVPKIWKDLGAMVWEVLSKATRESSMGAWLDIWTLTIVSWVN